MTNRGGSGNDTGSSVLDQLQFVDGLVGQTKQKEVTVIKMGCDQAVDQNNSTVG